MLAMLERHEQREAARPRQGLRKVQAVRGAGKKRRGPPRPRLIPPRSLRERSLPENNKELDPDSKPYDGMQVVATWNMVQDFSM